MTRPLKSGKSSWLPAILLSVAVVGLIGLAFGSTFLMVRDTRDRARQNYEQVLNALQATEAERLLLEQQIESLRTHVDAVRLQARNEFRLILPGERIEVFATRPAPDPTERQLAQTPY